MEYIYTLKRISDNGNSTIGYLLNYNSKLSGWTLEDEKRIKKVKGETRIPAGQYKIIYRKAESPKTLHYREKYSWFKKWHLMLEGVPNFKYIYIHIGNNEKHTDGCILIGDHVNNNTIERGKVSYSIKSFSRLYTEISDLLDSNKDVYIKILD